MLRIFACIPFFCFVLEPAQSQELRGRVLDPAGAPVAGAQVKLLDQLQASFTSSEGEFLFNGVRPGRQELSAQGGSFEAVQATVLVPPTGSADITLQFRHIRATVSSVEVIGESSESALDKPGSLFLVSREELGQSHPMDANEVLRRVPGVTLREDSGPVAMRLNIGIRGLNPDRSRSVLMLEDGLPISLAPYGEPEMYYSPPIERMSRIEVLKGSGQIVYGPQTVGGVVNFITPDPPASTKGEAEISGGQRGSFTGRMQAGGSSDGQTAGWLLGYLHKQGGGFRGLFFDIDGVQAKLTLKPASAHTFALRLDGYDENSNSTYLGLTTPMFLRNPNDNPVPSDFLKIRRTAASLSHTAALSPTVVWSSAVFGYSTVRNWARADFDRTPVAGLQYTGIFGDTSVPGGAVYIRNSALNRNRSFLVGGAQSGVTAQHGLFGRRNQLDSGVRLVGEQADDQQLVGASLDARTGALRDHEDRWGRGLAAYVQNRMWLTDRLILTPGVRIESFRYERHILRGRVGGVERNLDIRRGDAVAKAIPGLGLSYQVVPRMAVFAGVHRGFAPPRVKDAITNAGVSLELDAELSWNYEAGVRLHGSRGVQGELTWFRLDFQNQIIPAAQSGGATTTLVNGGATLHEGVEGNLRIEWGALMRRNWLVFTDLRYMGLATARFSRNSLFLGNRLPYAPRHTFGFVFGVRQPRGFGFQFDSSFTGDQFADNRQTRNASADGTIGTIPAFAIWNASADYTFVRERFQVRPYVSVKNLTGRVYIASRAPQGIMPGLFRQANVGLRFNF